MPSREDIVQEARKWLGTRWVHQGRSRAGIDCAGLLIAVHKGLGLPVEDKTGYARTPDSLAFLNHIRAQSDPTFGPRPGSIVVFRESRFACHVGIIGERDGHLSVIHSYMPAKKVIEEFLVNCSLPVVEYRDIRGVVD